MRLHSRATVSFCFSILLCSCCCFTSGCYLIKQGSCVLKYSTQSVPIKKLIDRPGTPDSLKQFLRLVSEIRRFAADSIGLAKNRNYSTYVSIDKPYLINTVCASGAVDFAPYTWCYPLFGCWPLRGYFDKQDATIEAERLAKKGYDVYVGRVDAFSTLGFFSDPVYSFMKNFPVLRIADLIIHEQTHATLYIKNEVDFDEELASFMGAEGALWFIRSKYGTASDRYVKAVALSKDNAAYYRLIKALYNKLSVIYNDSSLDYGKKITRKKEIIARFKDSLSKNYDSLFLTRTFTGLEKLEINNAFIGIDMTYSRDLDLFYELYALKNRDLRATLNCLRPLKKKAGSCKENMRKLLLHP
jgi:predicted aminopeptidase